MHLRTLRLRYQKDDLLLSNSIPDIDFALVRPVVRIEEHSIVVLDQTLISDSLGHKECVALHTFEIPQSNINPRKRRHKYWTAAVETKSPY